MSKYTPGPWKVVPINEPLDVDGYICNGEDFEVRPDGAQKVSHYEFADLTLAAAAPDLLEALQAMLDVCYDIESNNKTVQAVAAARDAITKAIGEIK